LFVTVKLIKSLNLYELGGFLKRNELGGSPKIKWTICPAGRIA